MPLPVVVPIVLGGIARIGITRVAVGLVAVLSALFGLGKEGRVADLILKGLYHLGYRMFFEVVDFSFYCMGKMCAAASDVLLQLMEGRVGKFWEHLPEYDPAFVAPVAAIYQLSSVMIPYDALIAGVGMVFAARVALFFLRALIAGFASAIALAKLVRG